MAVMARETWTDERLDDLNQKVDAGFKETREEFRAVRAELGGQIAALHRAMLQLFGGMIVTLVVGFGGMIVALLSQS
jgi:hypothetical protein